MQVPKHLAIIIDGNRRWAKERGLPSLAGHRQGHKNIRKIGELAWKKGVEILTVFCFSTENWNRSDPEVKYLMKLLKSAFGKKEIDSYHKKGIKILVIGQKDRLEESIQKRINEAEKLTKNNKKGVLNLAISYGGRQEIVQAVNKSLKENPKEITEKSIAKNLWTSGLPDPDLIIRSGGEQRLSNFLTWQSTYSELCFTEKRWPDFNEKDLDEMLESYSLRARRFGK